VKRDPGIPKAAPATALEAYGRVLALSDAVGALVVAARSVGHDLELPAEAVDKLSEAKQALMAAHRVLEAHLQHRDG